MKRVHLSISGKVQGVGFRYCTVEVAESLGIRGWVRNLYNGEVEILAEGEDDIIEQFIQWCHRGPDSARVVHVFVENEVYRGDLEEFCVQ